MNQVEIKRKQIELCTHVLGLIVLLILGKLLGDSGIAYVAVAAEVFLLFWGFTGRGLIDVLGRILRGRISKGQYKNAAKMRRSALAAGVVAGALGSFLMFALAGLVAKNLFKIPYSAALLMIMAPAVFLRTISSVFLGYFQGEGTELPAMIASIARQIGVLIFGLLFGRSFRRYGLKVSALLGEDSFTAMYSGMGVALAVSVTEIIILLFLFLVYRGSRSGEKRSAEGMRVTDSFGSQVQLLLTNMLPVGLADVLRSFPFLLGLYLYRKTYSTQAAIARYGIFYGKYLALCGIIILLAGAMILGAGYNSAGCLRRDEQQFARNHFWGGIHMGVIQAGFWAVMLSVLAPQFAAVFSADDILTATEMFRYGSALIPLVVLGYYLMQTLIQMGGKNMILGVLVVYDAIFAVGGLLIVNAGKGIMTLVYASMIAEAVFVLLTGLLVCYQIGCGIDWLGGVAIPVGAACIAGLFAFLLAKFVTPHLGNLFAILICALTAGVFYWAILFLFRNFRGHDMGYLPGEAVIRRVGRLFRRR